MIREEMMERMSAEEFLYWVAYFRLEPFGDRLVASMIYNANKTKEAPFKEPYDFMTAIREERPEHIQTPREIRAVFEAAERKPRKKKAKKTT